jgi:hypothetical protein
MRNTRKSIRKLCEKPLAAPGLISYRYRGDYGYVMIGARDISDALYEAMRSTGKTSALSRLEVWNGNKYQPVDGA